MRLQPETFLEIRKAVHQLCGIVVTEDKEYLVVTRLGPVLERNGMRSFESLLEGLKQPNPSRLQEEVVEAITTKETSFNRDGHPFEELRRVILPELAGRVIERRAARSLHGTRARIWCAAVATGQEAYSVAMSVADFLASRPGIGLTPDDFPILATDISSAALAVARAGRYSAAEVGRGIPPDTLARYFRQVEGGWAVVESLRRGIEFLRLNLVQSLPHLGTFDLILCRNLLIYLDENTRRRLCQSFHQALNPDGILIIGAAESLYGVTDAFSTEKLGNTFAYRKK